MHGFGQLAFSTVALERQFAFSPRPQRLCAREREKPLNDWPSFRQAIDDSGNAFRSHETVPKATARRSGPARITMAPMPKVASAVKAIALA